MILFLRGKGRAVIFYTIPPGGGRELKLFRKEGSRSFIISGKAEWATLLSGGQLKGRVCW